MVLIRKICGQYGTCRPDVPLAAPEVPIVNAPDIWHSPAEASPEPEPVMSSALQQQFTLRLKRSARIGFTGIGWFLLLIGVALFLERV